MRRLNRVFPDKFLYLFFIAQGVLFLPPPLPPLDWINFIERLSNIQYSWVTSRATNFTLSLSLKQFNVDFPASLFSRTTSLSCLVSYKNSLFLFLTASHWTDVWLGTLNTRTPTLNTLFTYVRNTGRHLSLLNYLPRQLVSSRDGAFYSTCTYINNM